MRTKSPAFVVAIIGILANLVCLHWINLIHLAAIKLSEALSRIEFIFIRLSVSKKHAKAKFLDEALALVSPLHWYWLAIYRSQSQ
jgi:hypothetical protein